MQVDAHHVEEALTYRLQKECSMKTAGCPFGMGSCVVLPLKSHGLDDPWPSFARYSITQFIHCFNDTVPPLDRFQAAHWSP